MEVLQQHVSAPAPALPPELARYQPLLARLAAKARGERFADAAEIIAAAAALGPTVADTTAESEAQPNAA